MDKETKQMFELILKKLDDMDRRQENMDRRQENMEVRQDEIYSVVKSIEHSNNVRKAEIDNLTYKIAHVEGTINGVGELIEKRRSIK